MRVRVPLPVLIVYPMYYVYAIRSLIANYTYVGISDNVERRVTQHNSGFEKTTKPYRPFRIILIEEFSDRPSARVREKYLKTSSGKRYLRKLL
ncbi:MAG: GIY-YIG nuclease family protein [Chitinophagales bacterium]